MKTNITSYHLLLKVSHCNISSINWSKLYVPIINTSLWLERHDIPESSCYPVTSRFANDQGLFAWSMLINAI